MAAARVAPVLLLCALMPLASASARGTKSAARGEVAGFSQPDWSPDGRKLVFTRYIDGLNQPNVEIYTVNADGTGQRRLTRNRVADKDPIWSPDGKTIAFSSTRTPGTSLFLNWNLYTMDPAGGSVRRLTTRPADRSATDDESPTWSPDGKRLAFESSTRAGDVLGEPDLFIVSVADRGLSRLTHTSVGEVSPRWSPNGREILVARFSGQYNFEFVPVTGASRIVLLTQLDLHPYFTYSRDGKRIAFVASPKGPPYDDKYIYVATGAAGDPKKLSRTKGDYYGVTWSPDGKRIAFMRDKQIYVMNSDGSNERRLPLK